MSDAHTEDFGVEAYGEVVNPPEEEVEVEEVEADPTEQAEPGDCAADEEEEPDDAGV